MIDRENEKDMIKPNYDHSIMSVTNSLLKYYGATPHHATLPVVDELLARDYKNVVLFVMDGMGVNVLEKNLSSNAFLRKHIKAELSSVYPCTTTAATTSLLTGKTPAEHGWIGWSCYFKEVDKCIDLFSNCESGTESPAGKEHQPYKYLAYNNILNVIGCNVKTCAVWPFTQYLANTMEDVCRHLKNLCSDGERKFIYAYLQQPDKDIHKFGVSSNRIEKMMTDYNHQIESLAGSFSDTLLLITADHGMIDAATKCVEDYPAVNNALLRHICVEPRCCSMYVKEEYKAVFPKIFSDAFGDQFKLLTHQEFLQSGLLGSGVPHVKTADFIGDYVAVAVADTALWYKDVNGEYQDYKGDHAGMTVEELTVPLIVVEK